jgi:hypothetical protein
MGKKAPNLLAKGDMLNESDKQAIREIVRDELNEFLALTCQNVLEIYREYKAHKGESKRGKETITVT